MRWSDSVVGLILWQLPLASARRALLGGGSLDRARLSLERVARDTSRHWAAILVLALLLWRCLHGGATTSTVSHQQVTVDRLF